MRRVIYVLMVLLMACPVQAIRLPTNRAVIIPVGPFVSFDDGVTPETEMTVTNITCELYKRSDAGGAGTAPTRVAITLSATGGSNDMAHITDDVAGMYALELTAAQLNWTGEGMLAFTDPDVMAPRFIDIVVEPNNIYDSTMHGTDYVQVDKVQSGGVANATATIANEFGGSTFQAASDVKTAVEAAGSHLTLIKTKTDYLPSVAAGAAGGVFIAGSNAATTVDITGNLSGNVGGNVTGTIGGLTAAALKDFFDTDTTTTYASAVAGSVAKEIADNAGGSSLTEAGIAAEILSTAVPGSFADGTVGEILGNTETTAGIAKIVRMELEKAPDADPNAGSIMATNVKFETMLQSDGSTGYEYTAQAVSNVSATVSGEVTVAAASVSAIQSGLATAALIGTPAGASVSADIAAVKSDAAAAKTAAEKIDTNTELRTLLTGSDTALATAAALDTVDNFLDTEIAGIISTLGVAGAGLTGLPAMVLTSAYDAAKTAASTALLGDVNDVIRADIAGISIVLSPEDIQTIVAGLIAGGLTGGVYGTVAAAGDAQIFTLSAGYPATDDAYPRYTILQFTDATTSLTYWQAIQSYTAGRVVTLLKPLPVAPEFGDAVTIFPAGAIGFVPSIR